MGNVLPLCQGTRFDHDGYSETHDVGQDHDENASHATPDDDKEALVLDWALPPGGTMSVLMFGMSGSGKSALGNLIVGSAYFASGDDTASVTNLDSVFRYQAPDDSLMLLDTIGLGDTEISQEKVVAHIKDTALTAPEGIDVLLLVMRNARITDDTIARITYATEYLWGRECLLNLYIVITFAAPKYLTSRDEANAWIERQVEINWRFKHIFSLVGNNPNRFIFIDNPDPESMEPGLEQRRQASRNAIMKTLCLHPRDAVPPFTSAMMRQAKEILAEEVLELHEKQQAVQRLQKRKNSMEAEEDLGQLPGKVVRIRGLQGSEATLNGRDGTLQDWDPLSRKWKVLLRNGEVTYQEMENLKQLTSRNVRPKAKAAPVVDAKLEEDVKKAEAEKKAAEKRMAAKMAEMKQDKKFQEQAVNDATRATEEFKRAKRSSGEGAEAADKMLAALNPTEKAKTTGRRQSERDISTSATNGGLPLPPTRVPSSTSVASAPAKKLATTERGSSKESTDKEAKTKEAEKAKVSSEEKKEASSPTPQLSSEEKARLQLEELEQILVRVRAKIKDGWKSTASEVFGHLGGPKGSSEISPFSFNLFLQSAEPGIKPLHVGGLWRRADANCDGKLNLKEFKDLLEPL